MNEKRWYICGMRCVLSFRQTYGVMAIIQKYPSGMKYGVPPRLLKLLRGIGKFPGHDESNLTKTQINMVLPMLVTHMLNLTQRTIITNHRDIREREHMCVVGHR
jgi:hypothetical protein